MDRTVMGLFDDADAEGVVIALRQGGIPLSRINVIEEEPEDASSQTATSKKTKGMGFLDKLKSFFGGDVPEHHQRHFEEGIRRGGTLVAVDVPEMQTDRVRSLMEQHHCVDLDVRGQEWRQSGWSPAQPRSQQTRAQSGGEQMAERTHDDLAGVGRVHTFQRTEQPRPLGESDVDQDAFRSHYDEWRMNQPVSSSFDYEQWLPPYQFGRGLGSSFAPNSRWEQIEPNVRKRWEADRPGTWDKVKDVVRDAWEKVTGSKSQSVPRR